MNYQPETLSKVRGYLAKEGITGLTEEDNKSELNDIVNSYREFLYNQYHNIRLFDEYVSCHRPQCFPVDCNTPCDSCDDFYWGITTPSDMAGITDIWYNNDPLSQRSRWHEGHEHIISKGYKDILYSNSATPVPGDFATPNPILSCTKLRIIAKSRMDYGKEFFISADSSLINEDGSTTSEPYAIQDELDGAVETQHSITAIHSIQMPDDLYGVVVIQDESGSEIIKISPADPSPRFRRYKINIGKCASSYYKSGQHQGMCGHVAIKGKRLYKPLFFDSDLVEIGNRRIVEHFGVMNRYEHSMEEKERALSIVSRQMLMDELKGLVHRYRSEERQDNPQPFNRHRNSRFKRITRYR